MPLPWLSILDGVLGATDVVRKIRGRSLERVDSAGMSGSIEARLAGVVVSALKEAFDRDSTRIEFERQRFEEERERAERLLRMEWLRQAADREIGRLRVVAGVAVVSWLATLVLAARLTSGGPLGRVLLGLGWLLLLAALAGALSAQARIARAIAQVDNQSSMTDVMTSAAGAAATWLIVGGLTLIAVSVLVT